MHFNIVLHPCSITDTLIFTLLHCFFFHRLSPKFIFYSLSSITNTRLALSVDEKLDSPLAALSIRAAPEPAPAPKSRFSLALSLDDLPCSTSTMNIDTTLITAVEEPVVRSKFRLSLPLECMSASYVPEQTILIREATSDEPSSDGILSKNTFYFCSFVSVFVVFSYNSFMNFMFYNAFLPRP